MEVIADILQPHHAFLTQIASGHVRLQRVFNIPTNRFSDGGNHRYFIRSRIHRRVCNKVRGHQLLGCCCVWCRRQCDLHDAARWFDASRHKRRRSFRQVLKHEMMVDVRLKTTICGFFLLSAFVSHCSIWNRLRLEPVNVRNQGRRFGRVFLVISWLGRRE